MSAEGAHDGQRAEIEQFFRVMFEPGAWHEVRALKALERKGKSYRSTATAYHDDPAAATADAFALDALEAAGVYVTINPVDPDCAARAYRRIKHKAENTTGDAEILRRRWFPIDLDPERPSGISATETERVAALSLAERVRAELGGKGWPAPIYCSTPNGAHLLYRIDLPNNPDALDIVTRALAGLAARFDGAGVKVDKSLHNAARILRIPGTTGRKGDSTPERPHRRGELRDVPAELVPVSRVLLEAVATPKPAATPQRTATPPLTSKGAPHAAVNASATFERYDPTPDGLRSYLERHGVSVLRTRADGDGSMLDLRECPIAGSGGGTSVSVRIGADGLVTYHNLHNGGAGLIWADVREHLEPGYRAHSEEMKDRRDTGDPFDALPDATAPANPDEPEPWEPPIPLDGAAILPEFPIEALPAHLAGFVRESSASLEVHPDMPAAFTLGVCAAACQGNFITHVRADHREPLNLFLGVAAPPAELKSATIRENLSPLNAYQEELQERERANVAIGIERHQLQLERIKELRAKAAKGKTESVRSTASRELEAIALNLGELPVLPRLTAGGDILPEALGSLLNRHSGRMTVYDAEGGVFFANFAGRYSAGSPNFEILLKAHAGDDVLVDRQGRPPIQVLRPCLTVILAVQPDVVRRLADTPQFRERGLAGRFLFSFPKPMAGCRKFDGPPVSDAVRALYSSGIRAALELGTGRGADGRGVVQELTLTPDALEVFQEMARAVGAQMRDGGELHGIQDWAGKAHGAAARVAGVLHVLDHSAHGMSFVNSVNSFLSRVSTEEKFFLSAPERCSCGGDPGAVQISAAIMVRAWQIINYFKAHALHAYSLMGTDSETELARRILAWVRESGLKRFTQRDCHRRFQADAKKAADLNAPLSLLVDRHYFRREPDTPRPLDAQGRKRPGQKPSPEFTVNPLWKN